MKKTKKVFLSNLGIISNKKASSANNLFVIPRLLAPLCSFIAVFITINFCLSAPSVFATGSNINVSIDTESLVLNLTPKSIEGSFSKSDNG